MEVWADDGVQEIIESIEGIENVYQDSDKLHNYHVYLDPRYSREWLMAEIEAQIKIGAIE